VLFNMSESEIVLVCPRVWFDAALRRLTAAPHEGAACSLGLARIGETSFRLAGEPRWLSLDERAQWASNEDLAVIIVSASPGDLAAHYVRGIRTSGASHTRLVVAVGTGVARGQIAGIVVAPGGNLRALDALHLPGAGMHRLDLRQETTPIRLTAAEQTTAPNVNGVAANVLQWDRTRRALGNDAWRRLVSLRIGIVGCGRNGSLAASQLTRIGMTSLCLVDDDRLEITNLGETDGVTSSDVGRFKVEALADGLRKIAVGRTLALETVPASVTSLRALGALRTCDVLIATPDRGAARLATATIATLFHKVLCDFGTGVLNLPGSRHPRVGADIRLIVPGSGCLRCHGDVANPEEARAMLRSPEIEPSRRGIPFEDQSARRGSLRSVNMTVVGLASRLLEDLVAERLRESVWLRLDQDHEGTPSLRVVPRNRATACPGCTAAGRGDDGLAPERLRLAE
jgi:hypothetical protein